MKKAFSLILTFCLILCLGTSALAEGSIFAGGSGTEEDPWQIATADQMLAFAKSVNDGSAGGYAGQYIVLTEDLDLKDTAWTPIGNMEDTETFSTMFSGTFDGQGHSVSNLSLETDKPIVGAGIFGLNLGEIRNLTAENIQIHCTDVYSMAVAAVVGYNMGGFVHDISLTGENEIAAVNCIGGVVGGNMGTVSNCTVDGTTIRVLGDNDFSSGRIIQQDIAECGGLVIGGSFSGTIDACTAEGTVIAEGREPVGLGGIAGCLEMMDSVTNCTAKAEITTLQGGHAIGGLCGFGGTHSVGDVVLESEGIQTTKYPGVIDSCHVTVKMNVPGATHVGGLIGTGLYYYGEETAFKISNCTVEAEITGAVTPGAVAGRAENSVIDSCEAKVTLDGEALKDEIGQTEVMYESADQFESEGDAAAAAELLTALSGTYDELFPVITDKAYDSLWLENCAAVVGEDAAPAIAEALKAACNGTIYGQEAVDAFGDGSEGAQFDCLFINGVKQFVFDGKTVSGLDADGKTVFSHEYRFVQPASIAGMMNGYLYQTDDQDAGEFEYLFLLPDTPDTTFHIEFRYGSDPEALLLYNNGPYAYWLAAGIPADRSEQLVEDVIRLFCAENLAEMSAEDAA